jgi:succinate-semialdehyde dehydrogenase / glutarate-semialdehyde dehydrogenase
MKNPCQLNLWAILSALCRGIIPFGRFLGLPYLSLLWVMGLSLNMLTIQVCALGLLEEIFCEAEFGDRFVSLFYDRYDFDFLIGSETIHGVSLTGSTSAGSAVGALAGKHIKKMVLELGGSDPYIVCEDADIKLAAKLLVESRCLNSGQSCIAAKRWIINRGIMKDFLSACKAELAKLKLGDPEDELTTIGPLARADLVDNAKDQQKRLINEGAEVASQTSCPSDAFIAPSV